ncbi:hypothetical protein ACFXAE_10460, partial [Streptomyces sp. NPDC059454]|uniref:hypothetical protein n=1 Tax=Streptomyces sp. NPDC059454 TaxID=3346836 RepID=UPI00369F681C
MTRRLVTGATAWYDLARAVPETTGGDLGAAARGVPPPAPRTPEPPARSTPPRARRAAPPPAPP